MSGAVAGPAAGARRRIVFVNRYFYPDLSATSQMLTDLTVALGDGPFEVHVLCSRLHYDDPCAALPRTDFVGPVRVHRCWSTRFGRAGLPGRLIDYVSFYVAAMLAASRLVRCDDILVALTDPPMLSVGLGLVTRWRNAKLINWLQDLFPEVAIVLKVTRLPAWLQQLLLWLRNDSLRVASMNVVLGEPMRERLLALGIGMGRVAVIENWADGEAIRPLESSQSALRNSLPPGTEFVVQYSGNLGRAHDFHTILGAAKLLSDESGWLFLMVGGGTGMVRLQAESERLGLNNLLFLPYRAREHLGDSLAAADVHLVSLLPEMEGLIVPSKVYGVLAAGRPLIVIGDPHGEQAQVVVHEGCGAAIACGDAEGLAALLRQLRADLLRCREAGTRARALFERRFTPAAALGKWGALLRSAAHAAGAAAPGTCNR
jgi:glycosyltransferase involved in cell wall biosynthesis